MSSFLLNYTNVKGDHVNNQKFEFIFKSENKQSYIFYNYKQRKVKKCKTKEDYMLSNSWRA